MQQPQVMTITPKPYFQPWILAISLCIVLAAPVSVFANHLDVARLATQLNLVSGQLAHELRGSGAYSTIRQRSEQLSREAAELVDSVRRNRNGVHIQSQFRDVSQRFLSLEKALLRLNSRDYSPYLANEFDRLSGIYGSLSEQFHYSGDYGYTQPYVYNPPVIIYQQVPVPGFDIPRGFVSPPSTYYPDEPRHPRDYRESDLYEYPRRQVQRLPNYDHHSPVLDRQQRLDSRRPVYESGRRSSNIETSRRNHYE